jgi:hypothetical protein
MSELRRIRGNNTGKEFALIFHQVYVHHQRILLILENTAHVNRLEKSVRIGYANSVLMNAEIARYRTSRVPDSITVPHTIGQIRAIVSN